jgi:enoyl-CoA hydratase
MSDPEIIVVSSDVLSLTLNRPGALHALNTGMCEAMDQALIEGAERPGGCVLVRHKEGTRGFCAGGDIRMLAQSGAGDGVSAYAFFATEYRLNTRIKEYEKPYIAIMDGIVMGGGVGISVHGRYRIATENTVFAMPETGIGLFPDVGASWFLPRLNGQLGPFLALTGSRLKGKDLLAAGIATHFTPSSAIGALVDALERLYADDRFADPELVLQDHCEFGPNDPVTPTYAADIETMDRCFSHDRAEDIVAALSKEPGDWAAQTLRTLLSKSPQTVKVALRQMREGAKLTTFRDAMAMEYRIARRVVHRSDFLEGVRAVIVDKDNAPVWSPGRLEDVSEALIDEIFAPLGPDELTF